MGFLSDADAGVADFDAHATRTGIEAHVDPAEAGEFERVGQQIADDLSHPGRIAQDQGWKVRIDQASQLDAGCRVLRQQVGRVFDQRAEVERDALQLQLPGVELGQVEDIVEQLDQHLARVMCDGELLALFGIERAVQRQGDHAQQAVERGADLVAHVG